MKKRTIFLILILFSLFLNGCKYDFILPEVVETPNTGGQPISFATQVVPIFAEKCIACHKTQTPTMNADVAYSQLVPKYVNTASPESSKIYTVPNSGTHYAKVSATQAAIILTWIKEGAKDN
jgi:hypothetical protein